MVRRASFASRTSLWYYEGNAHLKRHGREGVEKHERQRVAEKKERKRKKEPENSRPSTLRSKWHRCEASEIKIFIAASVVEPIRRVSIKRRLVVSPSSSVGLFESFESHIDEGVFVRRGFDYCENSTVFAIPIVRSFFPWGTLCLLILIFIIYKIVKLIYSWNMLQWNVKANFSFSITNVKLLSWLFQNIFKFQSSRI